MENEIILYTDKNGKTNVSVRLADEDVWVTQNQLESVAFCCISTIQMWLSDYSFLEKQVQIFLRPTSIFSFLR